MMIIDTTTGAEIKPGDEIRTITGQAHELVGYQEDGAGSGFIVSIPAGKWGAKNHEEHRPHYFHLRVQS